MDYFYSITDSQGYIHSIDMLYIEWFSKFKLDYLLECVREIHEKYFDIRYEEYLERPRTSKYDFYLDGVVFGTVFLNMGKYVNYDRLTKSFDILPMFQLRFNPNKVMKEPYFLELLELLMHFGSSGFIRKYDYAIDIPLSPNCIKVFFSRKEFGLYKGTRYYGQSGRHNYLKIYNKAAELEKQNVQENDMTRVEYTFLGGQIPSFENIYVLDSQLSNDYSGLTDTDKAIVDMYNTLLNFGFDYDLKLGRKKIEKLSKFLYGSYKLLEYGNILDDLLAYMERYFDITSSPDDAFIPVPDNEELPFD